MTITILAMLALAKATVANAISAAAAAAGHRPPLLDATPALDPLDRWLLSLLLLGMQAAIGLALPVALRLARSDRAVERRCQAVTAGWVQLIFLPFLLLLLLIPWTRDQSLNSDRLTALYRLAALAYAATITVIALAAQLPDQPGPLARLVDTLRALTLPQAVARAALLLWTVGGAWLVMDAFGLRPLGFSARIVRLTAIHFHYAAFIVPVIAAAVAAAHPSRPARLAAVVSALGAPATAVGITAVQFGAPLWLELLFALPMIGGGLLVASVHLGLAFGAGGRAPAPLNSSLRLVVRGLRLVVGLTLLGTMGLALAYAGRGLLPWSPTIPQMALWHGLGNLVGVAVCGLAACWLEGGGRSPA